MTAPARRAAPEPIAGRELDALIAQKVMGIRVLPAMQTVPVHEIAKVDRTFHPGGIPADYVAPYSTDIDAAWLVVDNLDRFDFCLSRDRRRDDRVLCYFATQRATYTAVAPTAALAICRAALKVPRR